MTFRLNRGLLPSFIIAWLLLIQTAADDPQITLKAPKDGSIMYNPKISLELGIDYDQGTVHDMCVCVVVDLQKMKGDWRLDARDAGLFSDGERFRLRQVLRIIV